MRDWTSIPKQKLLVEDGKTGDCWRCCIAAILGEKAEDVPHFQEIAKVEGKGSFNTLAQTWLNHQGWWLIELPPSGVSFPRYWGEEDNIDDPPLISCGPSPRSKAMGHHHAIITVNGKMVYDPHPSNAGLTAIVRQYLIFNLAA